MNKIICSLCNKDFTDAKNVDLIMVKSKCYKCDKATSRVLDVPRAGAHVAVDVTFDGAETSIYFLRSLGFVSRKNTAKLLNAMGKKIQPKKQGEKKEEVSVIISEEVKQDLHADGGVKEAQAAIDALDVGDVGDLILGEEIEHTHFENKADYLKELGNAQKTFVVNGR